MNEEQWKALVGIVGEERANRLKGIGEDATKEREEEGLAFKSADEKAEDVKTDEGEEVPESTKTVTDLAKAIVEELQLGNLSQLIETHTDTLGAMAAEIKAISERVTGLEKTDDEKKQEIAEDMPRYGFPWFRASQAEETKMTEGDPLAAKKPEVPVAIKAMADQMTGGGQR